VDRVGHELKKKSKAVDTFPSQSLSIPLSPSQSLSVPLSPSQSLSVPLNPKPKARAPEKYFQKKNYFSLSSLCTFRRHLSLPFAPFVVTSAACMCMHNYGDGSLCHEGTSHRSHPLVLLMCCVCVSKET